jgi:hypothetical protein
MDRTDLSQCTVGFIQTVPACKLRVEGKPKAVDLICPINVCMKEFSEADWCGSVSAVRKIV